MIKKYLIFLFLFVSSLCFANYESPFDVIGEHLEISPDSNFTANIHIRIPKGNFLYAEDLSIDFKSLEAVQIKKIGLPEAVTWLDPKANKIRMVYDSDINIQLQCFAPQNIGFGNHEVTAIVLMKGCTPKECLMSEEREVSILLSVVDSSVQKDSAKKAESPDLKVGKKIPFDFTILFVAGLLIVFTPCILPLMPVVLLIAGISSKKTLFQRIAYFVSIIAGLIFVYGIFGYSLASLGQSVSIIFQHRWFLVFISAFFVVMSLAVAEIIPTPNITKQIPFVGKSGIIGSFMTGIGIGIMASPCTAPVLASVGSYVALQADAMRGVTLFVSYGIGMAVSISIIVFLAGSIKEKLSSRMIFWSRKILAVLLILPAIYYTSALVPQNIFSNGIEWLNPQVAIERAKMDSKPIIIRFTSKTCMSCMSVDKLFADDDIEELSKGFVPMIVDMTLANENVRKIAGRYGIIGAPAIVFTDSNGEVIDDLRLFNPSKEQLTKAMNDALKR